MAKKTPPPPILDLAVNYGSISVGDEVASLGLSVERKNLSLSKADAHLVCKRLTCTITAAAGNDNPDQQTMPGMEDAEATVTAVFDVKGFSVGRKYIRFHLAAPKTAVDLASLTDYPKRAGRFTLLSVETIPEKAKAAAATAEDDE